MVNMVFACDDYHPPVGHEPNPKKPSYHKHVFPMSSPTINPSFQTSQPKEQKTPANHRMSNCLPKLYIELEAEPVLYSTHLPQFLELNCFQNIETPVPSPFCHLQTSFFLHAELSPSLYTVLEACPWIIADLCRAPPQRFCWAPCINVGPLGHGTLLVDLEVHGSQPGTAKALSCRI